jgi:hypothetical protein
MRTWRTGHSLSLATDGNRRTARPDTHDSEAFCEERPY